MLVLGAGGFVGGAIAAALRRAGHEVVAAGRDVARLHFPEVAEIDLRHCLGPGDWAAPLESIDAVVNSAGLLQAPPAEMMAVHRDAVAALADACVRAKVRLVHISAASADAGIDTDYARSKAEGEAAIRASQADWVILRPSLVWSPTGSYGGTSALRGFAGLPGWVPLIEDGAQLFTPITTEDLAAGVARLVAPAAPSRVTLEPGGPQDLTMREIIELQRAWLGLPPVRFVKLPLWLVAGVCRIGDALRLGPITTTSLAQVRAGNSVQPAGFAEATGLLPAAMADALAEHPAQEQDRWHARLYFAEPMIRLVLALLWLVSGLVGLFYEAEAIRAMVGDLVWLGRLASLADLALAAWVLSGRAVVVCDLVQIALIASYTVGLTFLAPWLWGDPFGSLLKNLPILALIAVHMALVARR
ncbi:MAG: DoxX-like family protein [Alphaproteobacteria bacterium]